MLQPEAEGSAVRIRRSSHYRVDACPSRVARQVCGYSRFWTVKNGTSEPAKGLQVISVAAFLDGERFYCPIIRELFHVEQFGKGEVIMKKFIAAAAAAFITCSAMSITAFAEETSADVFVTISDKDGKIAVAQESVAVTDADSDGKLTINDAFVCAHDKFFDGGAEAGYKAVEGQYGLSIDKLWGTENGGSYGYYLNNTMSMGLTDPVKAGDYLNAFVYPDPNAWNTTYYSWFDKNTAEAEQGDELELTLKRASFDENYQLMPVAVEGAAITIDGEATDVKTDAEGKAKVKLDKAGKLTVSATLDGDSILIPPVLIADVKGEETTTTTTETTTTTTTTTTTATTTASTSTAKSTTAAGTTSPKTGDTGAAVSLVLLGTGVFAAFSLRKKHEN